MTWDVDYKTDVLKTIGHFSTGEVSKTITTDEENHQVMEFTDKLGQTILKRVQANEAATEWADTYYVYDDFGDLRYVLPPEAVREIKTQATSFPYAPSSSLLARWAFQYHYDGRRRMVQKKVPGAAWVYLIYDDRDRLVLTQDGNQRDPEVTSGREWTFTKYDALNRPIGTGIYVHPTVVDRAAMQTAVDSHYQGAAVNAWYEDGTGSHHGYSNRSYPTNITPSDYQTLTYYDDYTFPHASSYPFVPELGNSAIFDRVKEQVTGTKVKTLDGTETWLESVSYFDDRYRVIQTHTENLIGGIDRVTNRYDFIGQVLETRTAHQGPKTEPVQWTDLVNMSEVNGVMTKTSGGTGWNGGLASVQVIPEGEDGSIFFHAISTSGKRMIGLSTTNVNTGWNTIGYAFYLKNNNVEVRESGSTNQLASIVNYSVGDEFRIQRENGNILYLHNGSLLRSVVATSQPLMVDISVYQQGQMLESVNISTEPTAETELVITKTFDYDHAGRLLRTYHQINDGPEVLLSENQYNELGELIEKNLHSEDQGQSFAQSIDYRYNIRGWLTQINDAALSEGDGDYFGMELGYNEALAGVNATAAYNGNISAVKWSDNLGLGGVANTTQHAYAYSYDPMNRIKTANHSQYNSAWTANDHFQLSGLTYDLNGNIESLTRNSPNGVMDNLSYVYEGNRLQSVTDIGDISLGFVDGHPDGNDYSYDANGNATEDLNKGITSITYNYLNLPEIVTKDGGGYIKYIYDATGKKLGQETYDENDVLQSKSDYLGEFVYQDDVLKSIQHEEGTIVPDEMDGGWEYRYDLKDHLGNTRVTFTTKPKAFDFAASFESENALDEEALYYNLAETRVTFSSADANADGGNEVTRINGSQPMGAGVALYVAPGDTLDMEVYGYYEGGSGYSTQSAINTIIGAVAGGFGGVNGGTEAQQATYDAFNNGLSGIGLIGTSNDNVPAAFLNYMLFDEDMAMYQHGFIQISSAANMNHERMFLDDVLVEKEGLAYVWVSNESASLNWVYFDDMNVTLKEGAVIQREDFMPFGMSFNGYKRYDPNYEGTYSNGGLGWKDLGFRQYDITTGRFHVVDPLAELQLGESPYQYAGNNPVNNIDVLGLLSKAEKEKRKREKQAKQKAKAKERQGKRNKGVKLKGQNDNSRRRNRVKKDKKKKDKSRQNSSSADSSDDDGEDSDDSDDTSEDDGSGENDDDPLKDVFDPPLFKRDNSTKDDNARPDRTPRFVPGRLTPKRPEQRIKEPNPTDLGKWHRKSQNATDREKLRQELYRNQPYLQAVALQRLGIWGREGDPSHRQLKLSLKTVENEESFGSYGSEQEAVQEVLDAIKTANEEEKTTLDLTALKKKYRGGVHRKRKFKINGKDVDITIIFGFGELIADPNDNNPGANNDGRTHYDFLKDDGDYAVRIVVDPEDKEDLEVYLGISEDREITELLDYILPSDISDTDKEAYKTLLTTAKGEDGVTTDITTDDWESDQDGTNDNCFAASKKMIENAGHTAGSPTRVYQLAIEENDAAGELNYDQDQVEKGIKTLLDHMDEGQPVQVGVDYRSEDDKATNNHDKTTDHFIVLSSLHFDETKDQFYFKFYENGTANGPDSDTNIGTSDDNKIYIEKDTDGNYKLKSTVGPPGDRDASQDDVRFYEITQIRINGGIPTGDTPDTLDQTGFSTSCTDTRRCY